MFALNLNAVTHDYERQRVLNGVSFSLQQGEIACLLGPSGSGKTTVLLCIAGLERPTGGEIHLGKTTLSNTKTHITPEKRRVGMVFQDFALFPHLSVRDNIAFGLRTLSDDLTTKRVTEMLDLCDLRHQENSFSHELSGGEQQRVALARALAVEPDLLLLDEPFSRLDATLHEKLSREVREILKSRDQTTLFVTHNQNEAFLIADVGGVINEGSICQWGRMNDLYHRPRCTFVADFVGDGSLLSGRMVTETIVDSELGRLEANGVESNPLIRPSEPVKILLRPDDILLADSSGVPAIVEQRAFRGSTTLYSLRLKNGEKVVSVWPSHANFELGETVSISAQVRHLVLFPAIE